MLRSTNIPEPGLRRCHHRRTNGVVGRHAPAAVRLEDPQSPPCTPLPIAGRVTLKNLTLFSTCEYIANEGRQLT